MTYKLRDYGKRLRTMGFYARIRTFSVFGHCLSHNTSAAATTTFAPSRSFFRSCGGKLRWMLRWSIDDDLQTLPIRLFDADRCDPRTSHKEKTWLSHVRFFLAASSLYCGRCAIVDRQSYMEIEMRTQSALYNAGRCHLHSRERSVLRQLFVVIFF